MKPLIVRAHHIHQYLKLLRFENRYDPETLAENAARSVAREFVSSVPRNQWYAKDTMGSPLREAQYRQETQALYERFLAAQSDQEILVVTSEPDDICRLCATGLHCLQRIKKSLDNDIYRDSKFKDRLRQPRYSDTFRAQEEGLFKSFRDAYEHLYEWEHYMRPPKISETSTCFVDCYYPVRAQRFHTDKRSFIWAAALTDGYLDKYLKQSNP